jgi:phosphoribosylformylglycinamidine synthase
LLRNKKLKFINKDVRVKVTNNETKFSNKYKKNEILNINIAHNEGNFFTNFEHLEELNKENLIAFKYCDEKGNTNDESNPNGSVENIAGIYNFKKNILGMMPHPERMVDKLISNTDGVNLFSSLLN